MVAEDAAQLFVDCISSTLLTVGKQEVGVTT